MSDYIIIIIFIITGSEKETFALLRSRIKNDVLFAEGNPRPKYGWR